MYAQTNLPSPAQSVRNGLVATCIAVAALGLALPANSTPHDVGDCSCRFTSSEPETWGQFISAVDAAMKDGRIKSDDFITICGMKPDGRHGRLIPVYGLSGPDGMSPTISLYRYLPR